MKIFYLLFGILTVYAAGHVNTYNRHQSNKVINHSSKYVNRVYKINTRKPQRIHVNRVHKSSTYNLRKIHNYNTVQHPKVYRNRYISYNRFNQRNRRHTIYRNHVPTQTFIYKRNNRHNHYYHYRRYRNERYLRRYHPYYNFYGYMNRMWGNNWKYRFMYTPNWITYNLNSVWIYNTYFYRSLPYSYYMVKNYYEYYSIHEIYVAGFYYDKILDLWIIIDNNGNTFYYDTFSNITLLPYKIIVKGWYKQNSLYIYF